MNAKKIEQGRGPAPKYANPLNLTRLRLELLFLDRDGLRLCAGLSSQDLDRAADGATDRLAP
jgi:hypothetical protein